MHPIFLISTEEAHNPALAQSSIDSLKMFLQMLLKIKLKLNSKVKQYKKYIKINILKKLNEKST